ncbi:cytochrome P450 [Actinosynnema sp. ALI-1.44]|uniref:cytochrome P450 n=1 Tax=Actinosynnema sp. ALI-1.44 TaxID=1933779 RepID=UPI00097BD16B|nr:cytochrome P450 [Actinosynnema sp. ALI-1.44]ONI78038.1 cytochrome P450 [Actinosynnema sp. ALI-1.44]
MSEPNNVAAMDPAEEMFAWFGEMLETQPVRHDAEHGWQVFRHADVVRVLSDTATFSSDVTRVFNPPHPDLDFFDMGNLVTKDWPRHRKLRTLVSQVFTPRAVAGLRPHIEKTTDSLLDAVADAGQFDLIDALAYPLPITVVAELLGLPIEDKPRFHVWGEALGIVAAATVRPDELATVVAPAVREMNEYLIGHVRRRRRQPTDDLLSRVATAQVDGRPLADGEAVGIIALTLLAGYATTMALIGNAVLCFEQHPEAAAAVRADRVLLPAAIEEILRIRSPFCRLTRVTTTGTRIGGHAVPAGELVTTWIGAANRDPARFPDPGVFDIHRTTAGHVVFGHGVHFCVGAHLARLEADVALNALLDRYQDIRVDESGSIEFENPVQIVSPKRLPLRVST